jgi:hypothetical protein
MRQILTRWEPVAYGLAVIAHLYPVWANAWFVTLDGPCHLNCSRIMYALVTKQGTLSDLFALNPYPEPNCLGHWLMALLYPFAPARIVEKIVFTVIIVGTGWSFRRLTRSLAPSRPWSAFLGLPFLFGYGVFMGFINFSLCVPLLLLALAEWERTMRVGSTARKAWPLFVIMLALYLTHLFGFLLALFLIGLRTITSWLSDRSDRSIRPLVVRGVLAFAVPSALVIGYFVRHSGHAAAPARFEVGELFGWLIHGRSWVAFGDQELPFTQIIACVMLGMGAIGFITFFRGTRTWKELVWFIAFAALIVLYFALPDTMAGGSLASPRLLSFAMLTLSLWIIARVEHRLVLSVGIGVIAVADLAHVVELNKASQNLSNEVEELMSVAHGAPQGAVLLPLNYSDNWMHSNISSYIGAAQGSVVLDNFVATAPFAPVRWRIDDLSEAYGNFNTSNRPCARLKGDPQAIAPSITHVLTWKMNDAFIDSCTNDVRAQLSRDFNLVASSPNNDARLYRRK